MAKSQTAGDLRGKTEDELQAVVLQARKQQMDMRFDQAQGKLNDTSAMRAARRTIARAKTLATESKIGLNKDVKAKPAKAPKAPKAANKTVTQAKTTSRTKKKEA